MFVVPEEKRLVQVGQVFGRWTVLGDAFYLDKSRQHCVAVCSCGKAVLVCVKSLSRGNTKSCGCFSSDLSRKRKTTHGGSETRLYNVWKLMRRRCGNPVATKFLRYGGRGISVCDEWQRFEPFREWALDNGYHDDLSIDRIDNDGSYEPSNCRWTDQTTQANNRRSNRWLTAFGETKTIAEWSRDARCVVKRETLWHRIKTSSHSNEDAITTRPWPSEMASCLGGKKC